MKVAKSLLLGSAAVLATVAGAQAADLPTRKAAPVQYVKICDAYGAGFFYIPGTDTCLRVGGLVLTDIAVSNTPFKGNVLAPQTTTLAAFAAGGGAGPITNTPSASRDAVGWQALGRVELDARTQSPWGTVRTFLRIDSYFGAGATANTGALSNTIINGVPAFGAAAFANAQLGTQAARETTILNKAFIQFAGITAGRIQSMFDFYADAVGYTGLRGSNQTVNALAYTFTFGGGFSATLAIEDAVSHRAVGTISNVVPAGVAMPAFVTQFLGTRMPDVVANLRLDQPWGAAQLSGAVHRVGSGLYNATTITPVAGFNIPAGALLNKTDTLGFAVQGGLMFKLDTILSPGDVLWLQATYAKGAIGYASGANLAFVNGVNTSTNYGVGLARVSSGSGFNEYADGDCVWTLQGSCEKSSAFAITAALRHYWTPTISSTLSGNYYSVTYSSAAVNPMQFAGLNAAGAFSTGVTNYKEMTLATGLEWNPVKGFGIGAEVAWQHGITSKPAGLAQDATLIAAGFPAFKSQSDLFRGRVRMYRAF